jgi:hypothetical protein
MVKSRRKHTRAKARNLVAHLRVGDRNVLAPIEDISVGGAFLKTAQHLEQGTMLAFDIARPGLKRPLRLMGLVVEVRLGRGLGVRFENLDDETRERLITLLRDLGLPQGEQAFAPDAPMEAIVVAPADMIAAGDAQKMMIQLRGAIMEVGRLQHELALRERELVSLREEKQKLTEMVARAKGERRMGSDEPLKAELDAAAAAIERARRALG